MELKDSYILRWNNFETNAVDSLKKLQGDGEFCDVTLACDGNQVESHKVILAGGSSFFQKILSENPHPHPLIYLAGVKYEYLLSVLDFIYTGEANIVAEELDYFLDVAKDLGVKGVIENNASSRTPHKQAVNEVRGPQQKVSLLRGETPHRVNIKGSQSTFKADKKCIPLSDDFKDSDVSFGIEANNGRFNEIMDVKTEVPNTEETRAILEMKHMAGNCPEQSEKLQIDDLESDLGVNDESHWYGQDKDLNMKLNEEQFSNENEKVNLSTFKTYVCPVCGKVCNKFNEKGHMRTHTGEKPFQCLICNKKFAQKITLKRHTQTHTGEKPFQCLVCLKRFTRKANLKLHSLSCSILVLH